MENGFGGKRVVSAFSADLVTALTNDPQRVDPAGGQALAEALVEGMALVALVALVALMIPQ
jgi:hypothetical protein